MSFVDETGFVHPETKHPLYQNNNGDLCPNPHGEPVILRDDEGIYDFVTQAHRHRGRDRPHYDRVYQQGMQDLPRLSLGGLQRPWESEPELQVLLASLGNVKNRRVLLLGNGVSWKELFFLSLGAQCVYTDISIWSVRSMKRAFYSSALPKLWGDRIEFHAVDALKLPFPDGAFDIIYGFAFVHHLRDLDSFFSEVARCLNARGICRFLDEAYSPLWQSAKTTIFRPLQLYLHRKHAISPEDLIATRRGGFREEELRASMEKHGFAGMVFERMAFFEHLLRRASRVVGGRFLLAGQPLLRAVDKFLANRGSFIRTQGIRLVWGFDKQAVAVSQEGSW